MTEGMKQINEKKADKEEQYRQFLLTKIPG
jgi:hypothetical protein